MTRAEILKALRRSHVVEAIEHVDSHGVPKRRNSTKYGLRYGGRLYPPKYVLAIAGRLATGHELTPKDHSGGEADSNKRLRELGFTDIVRHSSDRPEP